MHQLVFCFLCIFLMTAGHLQSSLIINHKTHHPKSKSEALIPSHPYQDIWLNGSIVAAGEGPSCHERFLAIKPLLDCYTRPFTVLDIGAAEGYFSFRIASEYSHAFAVMIGSPTWNGNILQQLCEKNRLENVILLSKTVTADELVRLSECEHFDVVIAMNIIHHFGNQWHKAFCAVMNMGDHIIIETPPRGDVGAGGRETLCPINDLLDAENGTLLGQFQRHTDPSKNDRLIWITKNKQTIVRKAYPFAITNKTHSYHIESTFNSKELFKYGADGQIQHSTWLPGINLLTFKFLHGTYPASKVLAESLSGIAQIPTNDWTPHNLIVQGSKLVLIDTHDNGIVPQAAKKGPYEYVRNADILRVITAQSLQQLQMLCVEIYGVPVD